MIVYPNVAYRTVGAVTLGCDVYVPDGQGRQPACVVVHGGGGTGGDMAVDTQEAVALAGNGFVAVAVNYRLAPTDPYPAACDDIRAAVARLRGTLPLRFRVDSAHVAVLGCSAGGGLALNAAVAGAPGADRPECVASWSGPTDFTADCAGPDADAGRCGNAAAYLGCAYADGPALWRQASPALNVTAQTCPCYLANGSDELTPLARAQEMAAALDAVGVVNELTVVPGSLHAAEYASQVTATTLAFLHAHV